MINMGKKLEKMTKEPASKQWFEKHGLPSKKQEMAKKMESSPKPGTSIGKTAEGKTILAKPRRLTESERNEKTKNWPKSGSNMGNNPSEKYKQDYQKKIGRAYSE